jgi:hypothetical protein
MMEAMEARMEQTKAYMTLLFFLGSTAEAIADTSLLSVCFERCRVSGNRTDDLVIQYKVSNFQRRTV